MSYKEETKQLISGDNIIIYRIKKKIITVPVSGFQVMSILLTMMLGVVGCAGLYRLLLI